MRTHHYSIVVVFFVTFLLTSSVYAADNFYSEGDWTLSIKQDPIDDSLTARLMTKSSKSPGIVIVCSNDGSGKNQLSFSVGNHGPLRGFAALDYRIDKGIPKKITGVRITSHYGVSSIADGLNVNPGEPSVSDFLSDLYDAKEEVVIRTEEGSTTLKVKGLSKLIDIYKNNCN